VGKKKITPRLPASAANQAANHILYVEGNDNSLDVTVLGELLGSMMRVRPLGNCHSLKAVARALFPYNKDWWFIIDRDHHDDEAVEKTWRDFPDPNQHNLLIWRRKELENYLLEPAWLTQSRYILAGHDEATLRQMLCKAAYGRLWLESANLVLRALREEVKGAQTNLLTRGAVTVDDEAHALDAMRTSTMLSTLKNAADVDLSDQALAGRLEAEVQRLSGGALPLQWGVGRWRDLMPGKELIHELLPAFVVKDTTGRRLQGPLALDVLARDLFKNHRDGAPSDLQTLRKTLSKILSSRP
jgi:hypothetical protein